MFFTRLAVAALSFGSIAQVFAAPIGIAIEVSTPAVNGSPVRRDDLPFTATVAKAMSMLEPLKVQITTLAAGPSGEVTPELVTAMGNMTPVLDLVVAKLESLKAAGVDKDAILLTADGASKTTADIVVDDVATIFTLIRGIVGPVEELKTLVLLKTVVPLIQSKLTAIKEGVRDNLITAFSVGNGASSSEIKSLDRIDDLVFNHLNQIVASS